MSWNLFMVRTKTNVEEYALIEDEDCIPFTKDELIEGWKGIAKTLNISVMDEESQIQYLRGDCWSIEACFWDDPEPEYYLELQIRGTKCPDEAFALMKQQFCARIFDTVSREFIVDTAEKGFNEWNKLVDTIIREKFS